VTHPLPAGTRVTHANQLWAGEWSTPDGTAVIVEARGPYPDRTWEYRVHACRDFTRRPGPDNPMDRETWWNSRHVHAVATAP
jgi:hypothetical protein